VTSEVVVMNCLGVALAADSAATVTAGVDNKIFSADKLFMLSKHHPVGVMIYGKANLLGVPWETIIKMFRRKLGSRELPRLTDYTDELLRFLAESTNLFPEDGQDRAYLKLVEAIFERIADRIEGHLYREIVDKVDTDATPTLDQQRAIAQKFIENERDSWAAKKDAACYEPSLGEKMANRFSKEIVGDLTAKVFEDFGGLNAEATAALRQIAIMIVSKDEIPREARSGLVIAGFGRDDHFPVAQSCVVGEIYLGQLKYRRASSVAISVERPAVVLPFARADMINTFMFGIDPTFEKKVMQLMKDLLRDLAVDTVDAIDDLPAERKAYWMEKARVSGDEAAAGFLKDFAQYRREHHLRPIYRAIAHLPKDQLAHVASSLVNLNSFQKRVSLKPETVGGPIDVAVISKGDGFIWIERKHYFRPELNHHFFRNYYPDSRRSGEKDGHDTSKTLEGPTDD
jgi:hypothetical protein